MDPEGLQASTTRLDDSAQGRQLARHEGQRQGELPVAEARPMKKSPASSWVQVLFIAFLNLENDSTSRCGSLTPELLTHLVLAPTLDPPGDS